jgi:hypothetical protein
MKQVVFRLSLEAHTTIMGRVVRLKRSICSRQSQFLCNKPAGELFPYQTIPT